MFRRFGLCWRSWASRTGTSISSWLCRSWQPCCPHRAMRCWDFVRGTKMKANQTPTSPDRHSLGPERDRRRRRRYGLNLDLDYSVVSSTSQSHTGRGRSIDISSNGVLFRAMDGLETGERIRLSLLWPARLSSGCPLNLVLDGVVVRKVENEFAVKFERHEFRTASQRTGRVLISEVSPPSTEL